MNSTNKSKQFYIKGVDYQPGGSSGVTDDKDPLSDPKECARDIIMLQDLGINVCIQFKELHNGC